MGDEEEQKEYCKQLINNEINNVDDLGMLIYLYNFVTGKIKAGI